MAKRKSRGWHESWHAEAFLNRVFKLATSDTRRYTLFQAQIMRMHNVCHEAGPVSLHKERMGPQSYTWVGGDLYRFWVWETPDWRVYVSNKKGTCFEIREDLTDDEAFAAWYEYQVLMGLYDKYPKRTRVLVYADDTPGESLGVDPNNPCHYIVRFNDKSTAIVHINNITLAPVNF